MKLTGKLSDWEKVCDALLSIKLPKEQKQCFYAIVPDLENDRLTVNLTKTSSKHPLDFDLAKKLLLDENDKVEHTVWMDHRAHEHLHLMCANISHYTLIPNLFEIVSKNELHVKEIHIAQAISTGFVPLESYFDIRIDLAKPLRAEAFDSVNEDFRRYLQTRLKAMSIFDLVGPAMVGPSSSHTAGASRIGL